LFESIAIAMTRFALIEGESNLETPCYRCVEYQSIDGMMAGKD